MTRTSAMPGRGPRNWTALIFIGLIGGLLSGTFGVGGGIIMVPLLVWLAHMDQRRASATTLVAIIPAATVGSLTYLANGETDLRAAGIIALGAVVGAVIGSQLLRRLPLVWLRWMFIVMLVVVAVRMLLIVPERGDALELSVLVGLGYLALGLVMGIASGLFGIGGGVIAVPALVVLFGVSDLVARGTSLLVIVPTGVVGTIANVRGRLVDLRSGIIIGVAATLSAVPGVALALIIPAQLASILFAALLLLAATQLTVKAIRAQRAAKPTRETDTPESPDA
ncbi:MAG: sulfite exporter TauE/SafE family protein [Cryobacterium sp.]